MHKLIHVIENPHSNSTKTVSIIKTRTKNDVRFVIEIHTERYSSSSGKTMYSDEIQEIILWKSEMEDFRAILEQAMLFLEAE
ncbi:hypothetical protein [Kosakonia phage Kc283]|uniref:Uncharacterized protein n=1 Tax=Kosakonia phage Kc283 TaxID=2863195 RepID=A0AAE7WFG2_9CAUD|nr:hypothetical protein PP755_gp23 [Kosakonia phage Kc283]QYN79825.1 hypothetical protein [Kosakonia phage Kc283]